MSTRLSIGIINCVLFLYSIGLPCLSFDVIIDDLGCNRSDFPHSMYLVAGSQAEKPKDNCVIIMKVSTYYVKYLCSIMKEDHLFFS